MSKATLVLMGSSKGWGGLGITLRVGVRVVLVPQIDPDDDPAVDCSKRNTFNTCINHCCDLAAGVDWATEAGSPVAACNAVGEVALDSRPSWRLSIEYLIARGEWLTTNPPYLPRARCRMKHTTRLQLAVLSDMMRCPRTRGCIHHSPVHSQAMKTGK